MARQVQDLERDVAEIDHVALAELMIRGARLDRVRVDVEVGIGKRGEELVVEHVAGVDEVLPCLGYEAGPCAGRRRSRPSSPGTARPPGARTAR